MSDTSHKHDARINELFRQKQWLEEQIVKEPATRGPNTDEHFAVLMELKKLCDERNSDLFTFNTIGGR